MLISRQQMKIEINHEKQKFFIGIDSQGEFVCSEKTYTQKEIGDLLFTMLFKRFPDNEVEWYNC